MAPDGGKGRPDLSGLRVVMVLTQFMPEVFGGAEQQCLRLSRALLAAGVKVQILTSRSDPGTPAEEVVDGIPVTRLWTSVPPQFGGRRLPASISWMRGVRRWLLAHRAQVDLVHCHQAKFNAWVGVTTARRLGVPVLVKPGSAGPNFDLFSLERKRFFYGKFAARTVAQQASAFVGISQEMMQDLAAYGIEPTRRVMIPNGVVIPQRSAGERADIRARIRAGLGLAPDLRLAVFAGRMERQKNVETLLRAFAAMTPDAAARARLVLLGDGALMADHQRLAADLGLTGQVTFAGRVDTVPDYLVAGDLFVLPALAEGMSNAVLEAMSEGLPQVVSRVSGNTDLVAAGETGWLYGQPMDTGALTAALTEAFTAAPEALQAMSEASRHRAETLFSIEAVAAQYMALYHRLLAPEDTDAVLV